MLISAKAILYLRTGVAVSIKKCKDSVRKE
jgi:hypothetical protein